MTSAYNHRESYYTRGSSVLAFLQHLKRAEAELCLSLLSTARTVGEWADRRLSRSEKPCGISRMCSSCSAENLATLSVAAWRGNPGCLRLRERSITSVPTPSRLVLGERESHLWPWTGPQGLPAGQSSSLLPGSLQLPASASLVIVNPALRRHNRKNKSASELLPFQEEALAVFLKAKLDSQLHWRKCNKKESKYINSLFSYLFSALSYITSFILHDFLTFSFSCYFLFSPFLVNIKILNLCNSFIFL